MFQFSSASFLVVAQGRVGKWGCQLLQDQKKTEVRKQFMNKLRYTSNEKVTAAF